MELMFHVSFLVPALGLYGSLQQWRNSNREKVGDILSVPNMGEGDTIRLFNQIISMEISKGCSLPIALWPPLPQIYAGGLE